MFLRKHHNFLNRIYLTNLKEVMKKSMSNSYNIKTETTRNSTSCLCPTNKMKNMACSFEVLPSPVKSPSDKKEYKVIKLQNGLVACLIADTAPLECDDFSSSEEESGSDTEGSELEVESESSDMDIAKHDSETDDAPMKKVPEVEQKMAAAALCVGVGSFSDPKDIPGLAHFLEHMVFMGSEKYPGENDFDSFIKVHCDLHVPGQYILDWYSI
ncbi:hypothetical protein HHI36_007009 [Cryptolaemus montrouzieri]|uniref:Peptidase M16 N-terminal domain-containing protein n=1 Tax=Cryptolaemus montrouzieri TaxID=559131 RepID=A0ABD2MND5_9CUCU